MNLRDYQNNYTNLLFNQELRDKNIDPKLELIASSSVNGRVHIFLNSIPKNIKYFLDEDYAYKISKKYALNYLNRAIFPKNTQMPLFLEYIKNNVLNDIENISPHFEDIIDYEIESAKLVFYKLPQIHNNKNPVLETNIGLLIAGENISELIYNLENDLEIDKINHNPKKCFILKKIRDNILIETCNWAVFDILSNLNSLQSWEQLTDTLIQKEPSLQSKKLDLMDWYDYFNDNNIIK